MLSALPRGANLLEQMGGSGGVDVDVLLCKLGVEC
jgi:hypothetical protein